jgi:hypothetical protein
MSTLPRWMTALNLSVRAANGVFGYCSREGIDPQELTVRDLSEARPGRLLCVRGLGKLTLKEIQAACAREMAAAPLTYADKMGRKAAMAWHATLDDAAIAAVIREVIEDCAQDAFSWDTDWAVGIAENLGKLGVAIRARATKDEP